jgi:hypothetical protein
MFLANPVFYQIVVGETPLLRKRNDAGGTR